MERERENVCKENERERGKDKEGGGGAVKGGGNER